MILVILQDALEVGREGDEDSLSIHGRIYEHTKHIVNKLGHISHSRPLLDHPL